MIINQSSHSSYQYYCSRSMTRPKVYSFPTMGYSAPVQKDTMDTRRGLVELRGWGDGLFGVAKEISQIRCGTVSMCVLGQMWQMWLLNCHCPIGMNRVGGYCYDEESGEYGNESLINLIKSCSDE